MQGSGVGCIKSHPFPSRRLLFVGGYFIELSWNRKRVQLGTILGIDIETRAVHRSAMLACLLACLLGPRNKTCGEESRFGCAIHQKHNFRSVRQMQRRLSTVEMRHSQPKMEKKKSGKLHLSD